MIPPRELNHSRDRFELIASRCSQDEGERSARVVSAWNNAREVNKDNPIFISLFDQPLRDLSSSTKLSGLSFGVKDNTAISGLPCSLGCIPPVTEQSEKNSAVVNLLLSLGASCLGTTNLDRLCLDFRGRNPHYGTVKNPTYPEMPSGGSSAGSAAAVASKAVDFATGTDFGGSVRIPAALCGICGLKLTAKRIDSSGSFLFSQSLDSLGFFARELEDLLYLWKVLALEEIPRESSPRLLCDTTFVAQTPKLARFAPEEIELRDLFERAFEARKILATRDGVKALDHTLSSTHKELDEYRALKAFSEKLNEPLISRALATQSSIENQLERYWEKGLFVLTPTLASWDLEAPRISPVILFLTLSNLCGLPSVAFPVGDCSRPQSCQLIGPPNSEIQLLRNAICVRDALTCENH